jgi:hypothetical protein
MAASSVAESLGQDYAHRVLHVLLEREWDETDDHRHVHCPTCGIKHRAKSAARSHREGCSYAALLAESDLRARGEQP